MNNIGEINALLRLLEDPDQTVYRSVSERLLHYGQSILPELESSWHGCDDPLALKRIETIIRHLNFNDTLKQFAVWYKSEKPDLLQGAILLGRYFQQHPDDDSLRRLIKRIHQSCWMELNHYLTPLEQINVVNSIFYSLYKFKGFDPEKMQPKHFDMHQVADTRMGNNYSLGIIYQILCEMLDIPVYFIQLQQLVLLAYFNHEYNFKQPIQNAKLKIQFYIDANTGMLYTQNDVDAYLKKYKLNVEPHHFNPLSNTGIITQTLQALLGVYENLDHDSRQHELRQLLAAIQP